MMTLRYRQELVENVRWVQNRSDSMRPLDDATGFSVQQRSMACDTVELSEMQSI